MPQTPRELTPVASTRAFFGAELRHWRQQRHLSQHELGVRVHASGDLICKIEKALRWPPEDLPALCDAVLNTGGILTRLWPMVDRERQIAAALAKQWAASPIAWNALAPGPPAVMPNDSPTDEADDSAA